MRSRLKILATFLVIAMAAMLGSVRDRDQAHAAEHSCKLTSSCQGSAKCEGTLWRRTGDCSIDCFRESGLPGEIVFSGSANCGSGTNPGGGGGGAGMEEFPILP